MIQFPARSRPDYSPKIDKKLKVLGEFYIHTQANLALLWSVFLFGGPHYQFDY
jgi:hypothetical protein